MARPGHRVRGHVLGLGYTCTWILLVKLIKRLQNIILPDAVSLRGSTNKHLEVTEKKATYLIYQYFQSVQCCGWKGRPNIKLIDTCGSRLLASCQLLSIQSLNLQLIRTFFIIKIWFLLVLVIMCSHSRQASDESCMQECTVSSFNNISWYWSQVTSQPTRVLSAVLERIFSRPFSEKSSELLFQIFDSF